MNLQPGPWNVIGLDVPHCTGAAQIRAGERGGYNQSAKPLPEGLSLFQ